MPHFEDIFLFEKVIISNRPPKAVWIFIVKITVCHLYLRLLYNHDGWFNYWFSHQILQSTTFRWPSFRSGSWDFHISSTLLCYSLFPWRNSQMWILKRGSIRARGTVTIAAIATGSSPKSNHLDDDGMLKDVTYIPVFVSGTAKVDNGV